MMHAMFESWEAACVRRREDDAKAHGNTSETRTRRVWKNGLTGDAWRRELGAECDATRRQDSSFVGLEVGR